MEQLQNLRAIVTGGTSGIGEAIVRAFRKEGAEVAFCGRADDRGKRIQVGCGAHFIQQDLTCLEELPAFVSKATDLIGGLDILVNNASYPYGSTSFLETTGKEITLNIDINVKAPWILMQEAAQRMPNGSSIINVASAAAHRVGPTSVGYAISKAAMLHLTRYASVELGSRGIRVNSISPGFINSPIHASSMGLDRSKWREVGRMVQRAFISRQSLKIEGTADHIASAAVFLASPSSQFMTGSDLVLDGGMIWGGDLTTSGSKG